MFLSIKMTRSRGWKNVFVIRIMNVLKVLKLLKSYYLMPFIVRPVRQWIKNAEIRVTLGVTSEKLRLKWSLLRYEKTTFLFSSVRFYFKLFLSIANRSSKHSHFHLNWFCIIATLLKCSVRMLKKITYLVIRFLANPQTWIICC